MRPISITTLLTALLILAGCQSQTQTTNNLWSQLLARCGYQYTGQMVSDDAVDADFASATMVARFSSCSADETRVPFWVGDDQSRTWVFTRQGEQIEFRHVHRHSDGSLDDVTGYGGFSRLTDNPFVVEFPADEQTREVFIATGLTVSLPNVWTVEADDAVFVYQLTRPNRFFRVEFPAGTAQLLPTE